MMLINNVVTENIAGDKKIPEEGLSIYEVIRIFNGKPIFLQDNLLRLGNSLKKSNIPVHPENLNIPEKLNRLISLEHITEGNLKYILHFTTDHMDEYIFQIPHAYPTEKDYQSGVPVITYPAIRENPEIKYINTSLRELMDKLIHEHEVYEVLLRDQDNCITEGSRSNVFFIKKDALYTASTEYVLPGTSRKRVMDICRTHHIPVTEKRVAYDELKNYQAAFITGTSPLILPINRIDDLTFNPSNALLHRLMDAYFALLN